jgi:hypothetical protein
VDRIVVIGPPGSGKTRLAATVAHRLGPPHTEMDSLWWEPDWTEAGADVSFRPTRPVPHEDGVVTEVARASFSGAAPRRRAR